MTNAHVNPLDTLLAHCDGNISAAARLLGKHRQHVQRWVKDGHIPWKADMLVEMRTGGKVLAIDVRDYAAYARTIKRK